MADSEFISVARFRLFVVPVAVLMFVTLAAGCVRGQPYKTVTGQDVHDLDVSPDGQYLLIAVSEIPKGNYSVPFDRWSMRLCEFDTGKELRRLDFPAACVAYGPGGTAAAWLTTRDGRQESPRVFLCDPQKDGQPIPVGPLQSVVYDVAWLPDGRLASAGSGGMQLWDPKAKKTVAQWGKGVVRNIAVSANGRRLMAYVGDVGRDKSSIQIWDLNTQQIIREVDGYNYNYPLANLAISADGKTAVAGTQNDVLAWDVETGRTRCHMRGFGKVCDLAIFPDGSTILIATGIGFGGPFTNPGENGLVLYDVATGKQSRRLAKFSREKPVSKVALTPDARFALAVVGKGDIYRWKLEDR
jgi:WD40 repeat protein